jgi:hypothetical protein
MLYDPKWEKTETKADPYSVHNLIAWLEQQPADSTYDYDDCHGGCLLGQFWASIGHAWGRGQIYLDAPGDMGIRVAAPHPRTFGGALQRARALTER